MPAQTPAITRSSELGAKRGAAACRLIVRRVRRVTEPSADVSVEHEHARAGLDDVALDVAAVATEPPGRSTSPTSRVPCTRSADVRGDDHAQVADVDARVDVRLAGRQLERAEIEVERADAELVLALQVLRRS